MTRLALARTQALSIPQQIVAITRHRALYRLAEVIPSRRPVGRPANQPGYLLLLYGVLARVFRSGARVEAELAHPETWKLVRDTAAEIAETDPG